MSEAHRPWRELIGSLVLGHLDPEEEAYLRAHLDGCPVCRREAKELAAVAAVLPGTDPERIGAPAEPPPRLEERVLELLEDERRLRALRRRRRLRTRTVAGLAAAAVAIAAFAIVTREAPSPPPTAPPGVELVSFESIPAGGEASAELRTVEDGLEVELEMRGLPAGEWVMALERADGTEEEADTFRASSGGWHGRRTLPVERRDAVALKVRLVGDATELVAPLPPVG